MAYIQNTSGQHVGFSQISASTGAGAAGATVTVYYSINGGTQGTGGGTVTNLGNGQYDYAMAQAETNGSEVSFMFASTGNIPVEKTLLFEAAPLITSGTGSNQLSVSSGAVLLQPTQAGVTIPTVTAVGSVTGAVGSVTGSVGGSLAGSVGSVTAGVTVTTNNDKAGYDLAAAGLDSVNIDGINARQAIAELLAFCLGVCSGLPTSPATIFDPSGVHQRATISFDSQNNRLLVNLSPPA